MSLIASVYVPTGIIISGDSRTTLPLPQTMNSGQPDQSTIFNNVIISDSTDKVFIAFERFGIGTYGAAFSNNMPIVHYIEQFDLQNRQNPPATTQKLAEDLLNHFRSFLPVPAVNFLVGGYDGLDPHLYCIDVSNNTVSRVNIDPAGNIVYGCRTGGVTDITVRLFSAPAFMPTYAGMNIQDAIDYSRHLIRTTIDQMRFEPRFATVGGAIDTLVISPYKTSFIVRKQHHA